MLIICNSCGKIIGCGLTKDGLIQYQCIDCPKVKECKDATPLDSIVERRVYFVHFAEECSAHERVKIGFKLGGSKCS